MKKTIHSAQSEMLRARLVELRKAANFTQRDLAKRLGRRQALVARIELGERRIDVIELHTILTALGCDPLAEMARIFEAFEDVDEDPS